MFTGIIETMGTVKKMVKDQGNMHVTVESPISNELKIDQSVSHNGACLTVVALSEGSHTVTAIEETLQKTELGDWKEGDFINLERCMQMGGRLDGHIVQGHVDGTGVCRSVEDTDGSWRFTFEIDPQFSPLLVDKGSVTVNGVSLTVVDPTQNGFSVAIIPYTREHTNFKTLEAGMRVNLEFDIIGKYIARQMEAYSASR